MDELELIRRCQRSDYAAFEAIYELYAQRALRTAYLVTHSVPEAEDAVQEAFVQVWRRIDTLRDAAAFRSWFYRILLNVTTRLTRKGRHQVTVTLDLREHDKPDLTGPAPEEQAQRTEQSHEVRAVISALPETQRIPLVLRYYGQLTDNEIADALGLPVGTVKSRLYGARQAVQRQLADSGSRTGREGHSNG